MSFDFIPLLQISYSISEYVIVLLYGSLPVQNVPQNRSPSTILPLHNAIQLDHARNFLCQTILLALT
jgi:hypothetical protein